MAYCQKTDLLVGNIPTPSVLDTQKCVDDAANEIDSKIGFLYQTPVDVTDVVENPVVRPVRLLLKRLNVFLATGRLIMAVDAGGEDKAVHAYGYSLVKEATKALDSIADGSLLLEGVPSSTSIDKPVTVPLINNLDSESSVEAFYDRIANPAYAYLSYERPNPDGLVL